MIMDVKLQNPFLNIADLCGFSKEDLPDHHDEDVEAGGKVEAAAPSCACASAPAFAVSGQYGGEAFGREGGQGELRELEEIGKTNDSALFMAAMEDVKPLGGPPVVCKSSQSGGRKKQVRYVPADGMREEMEWVMAQLALLVAGEGDMDVTCGGEYVEETTGDINPRILHRLRTGQLSVQAWIDLHGLDRWTAKGRVATFLEQSIRKGLSCVLIVHGRGLHSPDGVPVLKESLSSWLRGGGRIGRMVSAYCSARQHDGGWGAVYVLLKS